jgi:hypothetical protein
MQAEAAAATRSTRTIADLVGLAAERCGDEIAAHAIASAGAIAMYPTNSPEECEYQDEG